MSASETSSPTQVPAEVRLPEREAQAVLLVRAFEEADPEAIVLSRAERTRATDRGEGERGFERFLVRRTRALTDVLERDVALVPRLLRVSNLRLAAVWIVLPALLVGLGSNLLGPEQRINVVANALGGLILWNLVIYVVIVVGFVGRGILRRRADAFRSAAATVSFATALSTWPTRTRARAVERGEGGRGVRISAATVRFLETWKRCALPLLATRLKRALHMGALAMVLGALGGMYARGLLFEYRASWESTFLGADQVRSWLAALLAPAAALTGITVPNVKTIEAPSSGDAAAWIHLYAVTTFLAVIVPRALLTVGAALRARRLAVSLPVDTTPAYYRRLFAGSRGADVRAEVIPYSYSLTAPRADKLRALLYDVVGAQARIEVQDSVGYGAERAQAPDEERSVERWRIALFNLAQTPESEVHGRLLEGLKEATSHGGHCLVLVDAAAWRERAGDAPAFEQRLVERRRTWDRIVRDAKLDSVHVDLDQPPPEGLLDEIERARWPRRAEEVAG